MIFGSALGRAYRRNHRPPNSKLCNTIYDYCPCPLGHAAKNFFFAPTPANTPAPRTYFASNLPPVEEKEEIIPPCTDEILYKRRVGLEFQSGDVAINPSLEMGQANESHETEETVQFMDENLGQRAGFKYIDGLQHGDFTSNVQLGDFLSRPVRILNWKWYESDLPGNIISFQPWANFFNSTYVTPKIANFAYIRCNLKLKIIINASPFYYGAALATWQPASAVTPSTIKTNASNSQFVPLSQRPHVWIYPANSEGGEMTLPFFWPRNWLRTNTLTDFSGMGTIDLTAYTALQSANGVSGSGVTIQVYAWAEDVELSGPTLGLVMQTDEYGSGPVSLPASAVASAAGKLSRVPIIGRFMTATQIGASAISRIASLFGYSNPPVIENTKMYRPTAFPQMANVETGHPHEKLTLDPKNELSVDPSVVGLPSQDVLQIKNLVSKESYITQATWSTADAVDTILFSSSVTPEMYTNDAVTQATLIQGTPMWWVSRLFKGWRGDIIFRFKFVSSQFHKGRVRISWDPQGTSGSNVYNTANSANVLMTAIVDLGKDTDVEFRVPYHQAYPWLMTRQTNTDVPFSTDPNPTWANVEPFANGSLTVRIQTALTAPIATSSINMMVFVRGADNLEFANPGMRKYPISYFAPQSGEFAEPTADQAQKVDPSHVDPGARERFVVNYGEKVDSLRTILYRTYLTNVSQIATSGDGNTYTNSVFFRLPTEYGYDPNGISLAKGLITTGSNFAFNYTIPNPIGWILGAFAGFRGSTVLTINGNGMEALNHIRILRQPTENPTKQTFTRTQTAYVSDSDTAYRGYIRLDGGSGGSALTSQRTNAGISAVLPNYSVAKFASPYYNYRSAPSTYTEGLWESFNVEIAGPGDTGSNQFKNLKLEWYFAGGVDLVPLFFVNVPSMYLYSSTPAP